MVSKHDLENITLRNTASFTSRGKTLASAVETKSPFLASGVDSRGKKGRNGSEGRELGSGARIEIEKNRARDNSELTSI